MSNTKKSLNALGTARALYLDQRRRKWQRLGPDLRRHKELFIADRPPGMGRMDAMRHWEHIFAGFRDSPYAAHWANTAVKVVRGETARHSPQ